MHKITDIKLAGVDKLTSSTLKIVQSSAGEFYTKTLAYNQTLERYEKTMIQFGGMSFKAIPLTIRTLRYLREPQIRSSFIDIKSLTTSRKENSALFFNEVERIKRDALTNKNVIINFLQVPEGDWDVFDFDDLETIVLLMIKAEVPHITIPMHPKKTFVENKEFFDEMKKKLSNNQDIVPQFSPKMKKHEGEQILQKIMAEHNSKVTLVTGCSPTSANHLYYYSYLWEHHPRGKLLIAADVQDTFGNKQQNLPTHSALKRFGFDITCRKVTFPVGGQSFNFPVMSENIYIYDDVTGGMLSEVDQKRWHGMSATDFVMQHFPANTGLAFREYVLAYNFASMNRTGLLEADAIIKNQHSEFITKRPILYGYWNTQKKENETD